MSTSGVAPSITDTQQEEEEFYPLAVLIEELRNEDVRFRLNSIQKLSTIALAFGYEKTRTHLIPFLTDSIYDVEDVMIAIADKLGDFVPYVGGVAHAHCLITPLESLALVEDANVREKAVQSLRKLSREHSDKDLQEHIYPLIRRLATGDWYSSRASACGLFAVVYGRVDSASRQSILEIAQTLASDDTPMVRKALAAVLGELALTMVGVPPLDDSPAAPSSAGNNSGLNGDQDTVDDAADRAGLMHTSLTQDSDESATTPTETSPPSNITAPTFAPINVTPEVTEARALIVSALLPLFNQLTYDDEQESVKIISLETTVHFARALGPALAEKELLPGLEKVTQFKSWRARCLLAKKLSLLQSVLGQKVTRRCLLDIFISLLEDDIAEVRSAAACQIKSFTSGLLNGQTLYGSGSNPAARSTDAAMDTAPIDDEAAAAAEPTTPKASSSTEDPLADGYADPEVEAFIVQRLIPTMVKLNADSNVHVKSKLGVAVLGLAPLLGKNLTITHLLPIILAQLKDESPDVRLSLISNLEQINSVIGVDQVSASLLPAIVELAKVSVWRIRLAVINQMPLLADQLGEAFFGDGLMQLFLKWLADAAYAVREAAVLNLTRLTQKFGSEWAKNFFLTEVAQLSHNENYLQRMISLQCIMSLSPVMDQETCSSILLPTALKMDHDRVPNVRFKVAQALAQVGAVVGSSEVLPCLRGLLEDTDIDVKYFAAESIDYLKEKENGGTKPKAAEKMDIQDVPIETATS